jgi:hypothetical protein
LKLKEKLTKIRSGAIATVILTVLTPAFLTTGAFALPPSNDDFGSATVISSLPFSDSLNTAEATRAGDDPDCAASSHTVWYTFTPDKDITVQANTFGSDYDTILCLYTGSQGSLDNPATNDDASFDTKQSQISFDATAGQTYFFMVGSPYGGPGGNLVFNIDEGSPPPPPPREFNMEVSINPIADVQPRTGLVTIGGTIDCSEPASISISGEVVQISGQRTVKGSFSQSVVCGPAVEGQPGPWFASLQGQNGAFVAGRASVNVFAEGCGISDCDQDQDSRTVRLQGVR